MCTCVALERFSSAPNRRPSEAEADCSEEARLRDTKLRSSFSFSYTSLRAFIMKAVCGASLSLSLRHSGHGKTGNSPMTG